MENAIRGEADLLRGMRKKPRTKSCKQGGPRGRGVYWGFPWDPRFQIGRVTSAKQKRKGDTAWGNREGRGGGFCYARGNGLHRGKRGIKLGFFEGRKKTTAREMNDRGKRRLDW